MRFVLDSAYSFAAWERAILAWGGGYSIFALLQSNDYGHLPHARYRLLGGAGARAKLVLNQSQGAWAQWQRFMETWAEDWRFGILSYELKDDVEKLNSKHDNPQNLPVLVWFVPEILILWAFDQNEIEIQAPQPQQVWAEIQAQIQTAPPPAPPPQILRLWPDHQPQAYLDKIEQVLELIRQGEVYELNFCQAFWAETKQIQVLDLYQRLNALSKPPFAAYFRHQDSHLLCASPERFLQKQGPYLRSQPIKGTIKRGQNPQQDQILAQTLQHSPKDQAENIMIVDLVRNDLSRSCLPTSVEVEELFGLYSFAQVHQLISTIRGRLPNQDPGWEALRLAFPMGSMTGAPKVSSMIHIDQLEATRRTWYSGSLGYAQPNGDYDFNVIIRSLIYDAQSQLLRFQVGGAIVYDSEPKAEYQECLLKAQAIFQVLGLKSPPSLD